MGSSGSSNTISGGTAKCAAQAPNHFWNGKGYVATWKFGCRAFEQHEAREYCQSMGMEPVSLDTPEKQNEFNRLIAQDAQRFFWTGGIVDHANQLVGLNQITELLERTPHQRSPVWPFLTISMLMES